MKELAVIIPLFNAGIAIDNCLRSLQQQIVAENLQLYISDDGSFDMSSQMAEEKLYNLSNVVVLHNTNHGVSFARRSAFSLTIEDWIGFVDADDEVDSNFYALLLKNAHDHQVQISHCGYQTIVNGGERIHKFYDTGLRKRYNQSEALKALLTGDLFEPSLCNKIFQRQLLKDVLDFDYCPDNIRINEDLLLNFYLFKRAETSYFEDRCLYHYLAHSNSVTRSRFQEYKVLDPVKVRKIILENSPHEFYEICLLKYINTIVGAIANLTLHHSNVSQSDLRKQLHKYKTHWSLLSIKDQIKLHLTLFSPKLLSILVWIYRALRGGKQYE